MANDRFLRNIIVLSIVFAALSPGRVSAAIGYTKGVADVSPSGEATYSIPLFAPPGTNGLTPNLSLVYGHRSEEGLAGVGWNVSGLSEIARCAKTIAQNNSTDGVNLGTSDAYCLDGNQLRRVSGTYGVSGSTYRTEVDLISRITANGTAGNGPAWFQVEAKDGLIYEYGNSSDSRIESLATGYTTTARSWTLSKIKDRSGNEIRFTYIEDGAPFGSYRINKVEYRINSSAGLSAPGYRMEFVYETQPAADVDIQYGAGGLIEDIKRLDRVDVWYLGVVPNTLVRRFDITYESSLSSASRSRVQSVTECAGSVPDCLSATTFTYQNGTNGLASTVLSGATIPTGVTPLPLDINGDGRTDLVYASAQSGGKWMYQLANSSGGYNTPQNSNIDSTNHRKAFVIDYDSDGDEDLLVPYSGTTWWAILGGPSGLQSPINTNTPAESGNKNAVALDMNGDGRDDLVYRAQGLWVRYRLTTVGFSATPTQLAFGGNGQVIQSLNNFKMGRTARFDANGDGLEDIGIFRSVVRVGHYFHVILGGGGDFNISNVNSNSGGFPIDVNGDGYGDVAYYHAATGGFWYRLSSGEALGPQISIGAFSNYDLSNAMPMDWDSDGFEDIVIPNTTTGTLYLIRSQGHSFSSPTNTNIPSSSFAKLFRTDSNGDGMDDMASVDSSGNYAHKPHAGVTPDLLTTVTDGNGNTSTFQYASITDPSVYTRYANAVFPQQDYQQPSLVVKTITHSDGVGGTYNLSFKYEGAQQNLQGRGLSGFDVRIATDSRDGNIYTERYRRDFPYRGRVYQSDINIGDLSGTLVHRTTYTWQAIVGGAGYETYHFPYVSQSVERNYEGEGAFSGQQIDEKTTTYLVDIYGTTYDSTVTSVEKSTANGLLPGASYIERTKFNAITNATTNWCIGKPSQIERIHSHNQSYGTQITRTTGLSWNIGYSCRLNSSTVEPGSGYQVVSTYGYDNFGNKSSTTVSPSGMSARTEYTGWGTTGQFPQTSTNALGQVSTFTWDYAFGTRLSEADPNGIVASATYDVFGRIATATNPNLTKVIYTRSACNAGNNYCGIGYSRANTKVELGLKQPGGTQIRYDNVYLDSLERVIQIGSQTLTGALRYQRTVYDQYGRISQRSSPDYLTNPAYYATTQYDRLGRPKTLTRPIDDGIGSLDQFTSVYYEGLTTRIVDAEGNQSKKVSDAKRRVYQSTDEAGYYQQFEFDAFGSVRRVKDSLGNTHAEISYDYGLQAFRRTVSDMNLGLWTYTPNALGEEVGYSDAKSQAFTATFDKLGRPLTRVEAEGTTTWTWGTSAASNNIGRLASVSGPGHSQSYSYDSRGRVTQHITTSDATYNVNYTFDSNTGLLNSVEYPTSTDSFRLKVLREYQNGILKRVKRSDGAQQVLWEANVEDAFGNVIDASLGNGVDTVSGYDGVTGRLQYVQSGLGGGAGLQNLEYRWDKVGNLKQRSDVNRTLDEDFFYDSRYRVDYSKLNGTQNLDLSYNDLGNILVKDDVSPSTWIYHASKKNAVIAAGSNSYTYDANGNMLTRNGDNITWSSFNYPTVVEDGTRTYTYAYDANRQKWKYVYDNGTTSETTYYVSGIFEKNVHSGDTEFRHFIQARGQAFAIHIRRVNGSDYDRYILRDHQGSVASLLNSSGGVDVNQSFSAFGERRDPTDWSGAPSAADLTKIANTMDRGYTDHNHLQDSSLVHMNGRVMDARIGRFLSPDPYVTKPGNTQNWNRFSYVSNNPMTYTDPSGFCEAACAYVIKAIFGSVINKILGGGVSPSPPNYCFVAGPVGCRGAAPVKTRVFVIDIFSNPGFKIDFGGMQSDPLLIHFDQSSEAWQDGAGTEVDNNITLLLIEVGIGFTPAGVYADIWSAITGKSPITGERLAGWERVIVVVPLASEIRSANRIRKVASDVPDAGSIRKVNPTEGTQNCVNCSIATDATLAGRSASALPGGPTSISVLEETFGGAFRAVSGRNEIEAIMSAAGPGSRGIVFGARGDGVGHVFNVVNQNGVVRFLDGQTGRAASFEGFTSFRFLPTN